MFAKGVGHGVFDPYPYRLVIGSVLTITVDPLTVEGINAPASVFPEALVYTCIT